MRKFIWCELNEWVKWTRQKEYSAKNHEFVTIFKRVSVLHAEHFGVECVCKLIFFYFYFLSQKPWVLFPLAHLLCFFSPFVFVCACSLRRWSCCAVFNATIFFEPSSEFLQFFSVIVVGNSYFFSSGFFFLLDFFSRLLFVKYLRNAWTLPQW